MEELIKHAFRKEISLLDKRIAEVEELGAINERLKAFNWVFLHPFSQGGDMGVIKNILDSGQDMERRVLSLFASKFLSLRATIHFTDGLFKTRPFLGDYAVDIDESIVLCLQKDFHGAINILIPVIEGTLRKCLVHERGIKKKSEVSIEALVKVMDSWIAQYVEINRNYLREKHKDLISLGVYFHENQEKEILRKTKLYFSLWIDQLKGYLEGSLYLDTRRGTVSDKFNRHAIFHALEDNIEFSFSNYLRLFNCIHFISWAIGSITPGCSVLSEANEDEVLKKWFLYMKILSASEALERTKGAIYGRSPESFRPYMDKTLLSVIDRPASAILDALTILDFEAKNEKILYPIPKNPFKALIFLLLTNLASKFSPRK